MTTAQFLKVRETWKKELTTAIFVMRKAQREREERVERNRLFGSGNAQWRPADSSVCRSIAKRGFRRDNVVSLCCGCVHSVFQLSTNTPFNMLTARDHTCTLCDHTLLRMLTVVSRAKSLTWQTSQWMCLQASENLINAMVGPALHYSDLPSPHVNP